MVTQELVQQAMEELNRPITTKQLLNYMIERKMIEKKEWDMKMVVSRALLALKKWEVVDRVIQGHTGNVGHIWYLVKNGRPEHDSKTCQECKNRNMTFNHYITQRRMQWLAKKKRITNDHFMSDNHYMGGNMNG